MNYTKILTQGMNKLNEADINFTDLLVANEVDCQITNTHEQDQFDLICEVAKHYWLRCPTTVALENVVHAVLKCVADKIDLNDAHDAITDRLD